MLKIIIKLLIFIEVLTIPICGLVRIFIPFPFITTTLTVMAVTVGCFILAIIITPILEWWLKS